jgi:hypothetical protein
MIGPTTAKLPRAAASTVLATALATALAPAALGAQSAASATIPGFNVTYTPPLEWQVGAQEGRAHVWVQPASGSALFVFAGAFSPITLAFGDAGSVLEELPAQEPEMIEPLGERSFGERTGVSATFRARGADGTTIIVRIAAVSLAGVTTLGAVALVPADRHEARTAAFDALERSLATARAGTLATDQVLARTLSGTWHKQSGYNSSGAGGGGFIDEERWTLAEDGRFTHVKSFTASVPGAAIAPSREEQSGTWRAIGGALVLEADGETVTVSVAPDGQTVQIAGARFIRR